MIHKQKLPTAYVLYMYDCVQDWKATAATDMEKKVMARSRIGRARLVVRVYKVQHVIARSGSPRTRKLKRDK